MPEKSTRLMKLTYGLSGVALALLVILLATSFWMFSRNQEATHALMLAREQRGTLFRLLLSLQDAETGQRGYLLTNNPSYLEPYQNARRLVGERFEAVQKVYPLDLIAKSEIGSLIAQKLQELAETIRLVQANEREQAMAIVLKGDGEKLMSTLRDRIEDLVTKADDDIGASVDKQVSVAGQTRIFTTVSALAMLIAALGAIVTIVRYTRELITARAEIEATNVNLEGLVQERTADVYRANEEIQRFAYIVSHDLRSPLVNIMGFTSELETSLKGLEALAAEPALAQLEAGSDAKRAIETDIPESIDFIRRSTIKMDGLIKAILQLSREGQRVLTPERIDLGALMSSMEDSVRHRLDELEGQLTIRRPLSIIESDRLALEQIFSNLIDNAIKYRRPSVPLRIVIFEEPSRIGDVTIAVEDNGRGIAADDLDRIFDLFRRAGAQDQPGEGIGLAHVRSLARRLGGDVAVTSTPDTGTIFRVRLNRRHNPEKRL